MSDVLSQRLARSPWWRQNNATPLSLCLWLARRFHREFVVPFPCPNWKVRSCSHQIRSNMLRVNSLFLAATALAAMMSPVSAFVAPSPSVAFSRSSQIAMSSNEEEVAALEARLRELKENPPPEEESTPMTPEALEMVQGKDMLLSEAELYQAEIMSEVEEEGNIISSVLTVVGALLFLVLFAQVPIGQEGLSQYSATGSSAVKTIDLGDLNQDVARK